MDSPQHADIIVVTAEIAALVDPSRIANVAAAYSYPFCSSIQVLMIASAIFREKNLWEEYYFLLLELFTS
jgi:hypothetical protein